MSNVQMFLVALGLCAFGGGLIYLGVYVVATYGEHFRRDHSKVMLWDVIASLVSGPWSSPIVVAALSVALGATVLMFGASIAIFILVFELGNFLS